MVKRKRKKQNSLQRSLVVCNEHRPYLDATEGGAKNVAKLEHAVATVDAQNLAQANCGIDEQAAIDRCRKARVMLRKGLKHVATVSTQVMLDDGIAKVFEVPPVTNDDDLLARAEAIHAAASAKAELFVKEGVQPGLLDSLSGEIASLRNAKDAVTLAGKRFTESREALDRGLKEGDAAIAVIEGILATSADAPVGALTALKQAKRIGPRDTADAEPAATTPAPAAAPPTVPSKVA